MTLTEKRLAVFFIALFLALLGTKFWHIYLDRTNPAPGFGGEYKEIIVGELKYLDPILINSDNDESVSRLIFSSLLRVDGGNIIPDLAESWQVSPEGLIYTFKLKQNITFHDGAPLLASDVLYTVDRIKTPDLKSPLFSAWREVAVSSSDDYTVVFTLPKPYGPFLLGCDFGILPEHISDSEFSKKFIGSGPFKFDSVKKKDGKSISEIHLLRNDDYYKDKAYLAKIGLYFYSKDEGKKLYEGDKSDFDAIFGEVSKIGIQANYKSAKQLGLIANIRAEKLKDKALREKIFQGTKLEEALDLSLTTLDTPMQRQKAEEIKTQFSVQNINLTINYKTTVTIQDSLKNHDYDLLLYGFNFGHDRDPYPFWHSGQANVLNYAGYADTKTDIAIEAARVITDNAMRWAKYEEIYKTIDGQYLVKYYDPIEYNYSIKNTVKNFSAPLGVDASSRYINITKWYKKETRVRK